MKKLLIILALTLALTSLSSIADNSGYVGVSNIPHIKVMTQINLDNDPKEYDILVNINEILYFEPNSYSDSSVKMYFMRDVDYAHDTVIIIKGTMQEVLNQLSLTDCNEKVTGGVCVGSGEYHHTVRLYESPRFAYLKLDNDDISVAFNINQIKYIESYTGEYGNPDAVATTIKMSGSPGIKTSLSLIELYQIIYKIPSNMIDILPPACLNPVGC